MMAGSITRSKQRPDTLMQDHKPPDQRNLLRRTAGPYIWVTGCRNDVSRATDGLPSAADAPLQRSELAKSATSGLLRRDKNSRLLDQVGDT